MTARLRGSVRLRLILLLIGPLSLTGCDSCTNAMLQVDFSPGNEFQAVTFSRRCGDAAGPSTHVSVIDGKSPLPRGEGNILIAAGAIPLTALWEGRGLLVVTGATGQSASRRETEYQGMKVEYR